MQKLKRFFTRFVVVLLALQTVMVAQSLTLPKAYAANPPTTTSSVVINEIMWAGSYAGTTSHSSDEWVELLNTTNSPIDLTSWMLNGVGSTFTIGVDGTLKNSVIPANGYYLISHYDLGDPSTVLMAQPDWIVPGIVISNTCQPITFSSADSSQTDTAGCNGTSYFGGLNDTVNHLRKSMERIDSINTDGTISVGSGDSLSSWMTAGDSGNLSDNIHNFASPKLFNNDLTAPIPGTVTTGAAWSTNTNLLTTSWSGFADPETGIDHYLVGFGTDAVPTPTDLASLKKIGNVTTYDFTGLSLSEGVTYYAYVEAVNPVGLTSAAASSSGVTITHPIAAVTNLMAADVPNDNGGSIQLSWFPSADADHYLVSYFKTGADAGTAVTNVTTQANLTITGLENSPTTYQFNVTAVAANALSSSVVSVIGSAIDNLPPSVATLNSLTATCQTELCSVELTWQDADSSASYYQISYAANGLETRTMKLATTSATLSLQVGKAYSFAVYAFDSAGNQSPSSNQLAAMLTANQKIVIGYANGQQQTAITSLLLPPPTIRPAVATSYFVPATAQAAEPVTQQNTNVLVGAPAATPTDVSSNSDWVRLTLIILVLLIVALGFYLLSRTLREDETNNKPTGRAKKMTVTAESIEKRKRGRPKGSTKKPPAPPKPKRGRGRPKGSLNKRT